LHYWIPIAKKVTKFCDDCGVRDSPKRYIPDNKYKNNKSVSEILFNITHLLQNLGEGSYRVWAFRKAAWAVDELDVDLKSVYESGTLKQVENLGDSTIKVIAEIFETGESTLYNELQRRWRM